MDETEPAPAHLDAFFTLPQIVVVDDEPYNCELLEHLLEGESYSVHSFLHTQTAFEFIKTHPPELILLDITLPEMSGYDFCLQIKQISELQDIPVIFLSARTREDDIIKGFEVGGVDYIVKPFSAPELLARVKTHLILQNQRKRLEILNEAKDRFLNVTSHDLRNPLSSILMTGKLLRKPQYQSPEMQERLLSVIERSTRTALSIVQDLVSTQDWEQFPQTWQPLSLNQSLIQMQKVYENVARTKSIDILVELNVESATIFTIPHSFLQILDNLVSNALKFTPRHKTVCLSLEQQLEQSAYLVRVKDQGPGFELQKQDDVFEKFTGHSAQPTGHEISMGVGLAVVKELCDKLSIKIALENSAQGACFVLHCPLMRMRVKGHTET